MEVKIYNPQGYIFYCPNHITKIVETENARFIENGETHGSVKPCDVEIQEVRVEVPLSITSSQVVVHTVV